MLKIRCENIKVPTRRKDTAPKSNIENIVDMKTEMKASLNQFNTQYVDKFVRDAWNPGLEWSISQFAKGT